ncbi:MAG: flagellar basal-body rod protein FlgF [Spirochaetales bacterium]|nr:flagellar basal-body rod protein FlgF [Spirochaetales bacterium]
MERGLFISASGMIAQQWRMDAVANNLANVDLNGYKRDDAIQKAFPSLLIRRTDDDGVYKFPFGSADTSPIVGKLGMGVEQNEFYTVFTQGPLKQTSNPFDLALENKGFFVVKTPQGERYTRNGAFVLGKEGYLETHDGYPVMGEHGPIRVKENNFTIDPEGRVWVNSDYQGNPHRLVAMDENEWKNTKLLDSLKIVNFPRTRYLAKQGESLWKTTEYSGKAENIPLKERPAVRQGFVEGSNVNPVQEMVKMIEVNRAYETNSKMIQTTDNLMGRLINDAAVYR